MSSNLSQVEVLGRVLDAAGLRHRVIAHNVANVNTPGYARLDVTFEEELAASLHGEGGDVRPHVVTAPSDSTRVDGNSVSLEQEMMALNKNTLLYTAAAQLLSTRLNMLRSAISGH